VPVKTCRTALPRVATVVAGVASPQPESSAAPVVRRKSEIRFMDGSIYRPVLERAS
jgi:hypothetical protein